MSRSFARTTKSRGASTANSSVWRLSRRHIDRIAVLTKSTWHFRMVAKSNCFHFQSRLRRPSYPEACGLRHLAFAVDDLDRAVAALRSRGILVENVRVDELTGKRIHLFRRSRWPPPRTLRGAQLIGFFRESFSANRKGPNSRRDSVCNDRVHTVEGHRQGTPPLQENPRLFPRSVSRVRGRHGRPREPLRSKSDGREWCR
jgi:catechol 2,3-dioxygenase-like lactoylglutathione lyase family enzyme